jgi:hypothetical protein
VATANGHVSYRHARSQDFRVLTLGLASGNGNAHKKHSENSRINVFNGSEKKSRLKIV